MKKMNKKQQVAFIELESPQNILGQFQPELEALPLDEEHVDMLRIVQYLKRTMQQYKGSNKDRVFYKNVKGERKYQTFYAFIQKGLPYLCKGVVEILNRSDVYANLREFEAIVRLVIEDRTKWDDMNPELVNQKLEGIGALKSLGQYVYDESDWPLEVKNFGLAYHRDEEKGWEKPEF